MNTSGALSQIYDRELLPYQRAYYDDTAQQIVFDKCRQAGITWITALRAVVDAAKGRRSTYYASYNLDMANATFMKDVQYWRNRLGLGYDPSISISRFASGCEVRAMTSNPDNVRSKRGRLVVDEAAFVKHGDLKRTIDAAMALLNWGGQIVVISTQDWADHYYNALVGYAETGDRGWKLHRLTIDDALEQGLYRKICQSLDRQWTPEIEAEWKAQTLAASGDRAPQEYYCVPKQRTLQRGSFFDPDRFTIAPLPTDPARPLQRYWAHPSARDLAHPVRCKIVTARASRVGDIPTIEDFRSHSYAPAKFDSLLRDRLASDPANTPQVWQRHPELGREISQRLSAQNLVATPCRRPVEIGAIADKLATDLHTGKIAIADPIAERVTGAIATYPDPASHAAIVAIARACDRLGSGGSGGGSNPRSLSPRPSRRDRASGWVSML
jgi:hypothetical protein